MIAKIAETVSAFFYSMDVIDEEEKGKSRYGIERRILIMKNYEIDLSEMEEMLPLESPTCIIGPWFFVHKS